MRVLLTGHQGYLGTVMAPVLAEAGHRVFGLDSGLFADATLGPAPRDPRGFRIDVRDVTAGHLVGFDAVIHLAALPDDPLGALAPELIYDINQHAAARLATLARDAGVRRFLYASTCSVYGAPGGDAPVGEDEPLRPLTPYATSKARAEDALVALADDHFSPVILRNATAFGFSPRLRADIMLNNLVGQAVLAGGARVPSDGTPWRPLVHAADIASAFLAVLEAPRAAVHARAFNVGDSRHNLTVGEIAQAVAAAVPGCRMIITGEPGPDPRSYRVDFSAMLGAVPAFRPRWTVADGVAELYRSYLAHGLTRDGFERRFARLARLAERRASGRLSPELRPRRP